MVIIIILNLKILKIKLFKVELPFNTFSPLLSTWLINLNENDMCPGLD